LKIWTEHPQDHNGGFVPYFVDEKADSLDAIILNDKDQMESKLRLSICQSFIPLTVVSHRAYRSMDQYRQRNDGSQVRLPTFPRFTIPEFLYLIAVWTPA
jgi:hypothetical protein